MSLNDKTDFKNKHKHKIVLQNICLFVQNDQNDSKIIKR